MKLNQKRAAAWLAAGVCAVMVQALLDHAAYLASRRLCPRTVQTYTWEAGQLALAWPALAPADYQPEHVAAYLEARRLRLAPASYKLSVLAIRGFFTWARGAADSPARHVAVPGKVGMVRPGRSLSRADCDKLLGSFDTSTPGGVRDVAILALLLDTAFRASEVCALTLAGLDLPGRRAAVRCKGGQVGRGKFSEATRALLVRWLDYRGELARPGVPTVFVSMWQGRPLTASGLTKICHRAAARAGLAALAPHDFRRTFAHEVLRSGAPERIAMQGGRWKSLQVFHEHYTREIGVDDIDSYLPTRRLF